jgi:hypothetical protein
VVNIRLIVCWVLLVIMAGLVVIVVSPLRDILQIQGDLSNYVIHLGALGVSLVTFSIITRMSGMLRSFLITAGASGSGWLISLYLHELLSHFFPTEPVTYILVFFIIPVTFLVGVLGATAIGIKQLVSSR